MSVANPAKDSTNYDLQCNKKIFFNYILLIFSVFSVPWSKSYVRYSNSIFLGFGPQWSFFKTHKNELCKREKFPEKCFEICFIST
jgi:hypothetical protein